MSLLGLITVVCERCGEQGEPATDFRAARTASTAAGWALVRDRGLVFDYCPRHAGRLPAAPLVPTGSAHVWSCPECEQGKHGNCDGWAWDFDADEKTQCQCPEVHP